MRTVETSDMERINKSIDTHKILDCVPNQDINHTFARLIRSRDKGRELGGASMRTKTYHDLDRLNETLKD